MLLGCYHLNTRLDASKGRVTYQATNPAGVTYHIWLLNGARENPATWDAQNRRLRLLELVDHPAALKPIEARLDHDPPYLVLPPSHPVERIPPFQWLEVIAQLSSLVASVHTLGLTFGGNRFPSPLVTTDDRYLFDLTGTLELSNESDPSDDVAALGEFFSQMSPSQLPNAPVGWSAWLRRMQAANPGARPLAEEVAAWLSGDDPGRTRVSTIGMMESEKNKGKEAAPAVEIGCEVTASRPLTAVLTHCAVVVPLPMPQAGDRIGRFRLGERLGEGGMGVVYRAEDSADGSTVAIKVLRSTVATSSAIRRRFLKEGRMLAVLDTPYVTRLIEAGADGDRLYLAMEFVDGPSLGNILAKGVRLEEAAALELAADAARGLAAGHALGIVHRDVKPDNLLLFPLPGGRRRVKVTDFGLARSLVQTESLAITHDGATIGTPLYMAPEQFGGRGVGPAVDVYGLGAVLYQMLTGRPPFQQTDLSTLARVIASELPQSVDRVNPEISAATTDLVARCLAKDPTQRPADAGILLRELEHLLGGEPVGLCAHPRVPQGRWIQEYTLTIDLDSAPEKLWPYVSNTERLNRAVGLPSPKYLLRGDPNIGTRRYASARISGMWMEWEEYPFEWVQGQRMGILREFSRGPFAWFSSVVELQPRAGGGTRLRHTIKAGPRSLFGRMVAAIELKLKAPRSLRAVYRRMDSAVATGGSRGPNEDPFELPTRLTRSQSRRLQTGVGNLLARGTDPAATDVLFLYLSHAAEQELGRIRPLALARRFGVNEALMSEVCMRAVGEGLLDLRWDVICPLCRIPSARRDTLKELRAHEHCPTCDIVFQADFTSAVELVFTAHPDVRAADVGTYCAGGPAHSPHVVAQARVATGEQLELELVLSEGRYRLRGPQLPWSLDLNVAIGGATRSWEVDLSIPSQERIPTLAPGAVSLVLVNTRAHELVVRVERTAARNDALTAALATSMPAFREYFPGELLAPGQLAPASTVTMLAVEVGDGELFDRMGEAQAFPLVQAAFRAIETLVRAEGGAVVKTADERILAVFGELSAGLQTAFGLVEAIATDPIAHGIGLRAVVHRGLAMVATINDRLDYYGETPRLTGRLLNVTANGSLLLSAAVGIDPEADVLLRGRAVRLVEISRSHGTPLLAYQMPLTSPTDRQAISPGRISAEERIDSSSSKLFLPETMLVE